MTRPRVLVTRPHPDAESTARRVETRGYEPVIDSLLTIRWLDVPYPSLDGVQGGLFTSANGVRGLARLGPLPHLPVWTVGAATAAVAREAGFTTVTSADGDVATLVQAVRRDLRPENGALLHVAGSKVAGDLAGDLEGAGFHVRRAALYETQAAETLAPAAVRGLTEEGLAAVLFFSPRTAGVFVRLILRAGLARHCRNVEALCLSPACAQAAVQSDTGSLLSWRAVRAAERPTEESLLALLAERAST